MSTISLAMIARNEAPVIARALQSARAWVDEMVVLDTGSSDDTAAVARSLGARVLAHPWEGFSASRNRALAHCTKEWILVLDADEELEQTSGPILRYLTSGPRSVVYRVDQIDREPGKTPTRVPVVRLFPNDSGLRFGGVIHERLQFDPRRFCQAPSNLVIQHWIVPGDRDPNGAKQRWYESLIRKGLEATPEDSELLTHLAQLLLKQGHCDEALEKLLQAQRVVEPYAVHRPIIARLLADAWCQKGDHAEAQRCCKEGLALAPDFPPLLGLYSRCLEHTGRRRHAKKYADAMRASLRTYQGTLPIPLPTAP